MRSSMRTDASAGKLEAVSHREAVGDMRTAVRFIRTRSAKTMKRALSCLLLALLVISLLSCLPLSLPSPLSPPVGVAKAQGIGWLLGWGYRKSHQIVGSTAGAVTNYQVNVTVYYGSGTDSKWAVYLNGKCRSDFGDVRFTADDGVTPLPYWIETKVDGSYAVFWVRVPSIPASPGTATIYIYYGNSSATTTSNGTATFFFYDDFSGTSLDTSKWSVAFVDSLMGYTVSGGALKLYSTKSAKDSAWHSILVRSVRSDLPASIAVRARALFVAPSSVEATGGLHGRIGYGPVTESAGGGGAGIASEFVNKDYTFGIFCNWVTNSVTNAYSFNTWYTVEMRYYNNTGYSLLNDVQKASLSATVSSPNYVSVGLTIGDLSSGYNANAQYMLVDWIAVRNFVNPEPSHGSWGPEELPGVALRADAVLFRHWLVYSPNSTQFTHSFSATNTTTASYSTSYGNDAWAWAVSASPYYSAGVAYANTAKLVSNATISLPYSPTNAYELSLWAKAAGTGSYRRLWIKVMNGAGAVVKELSNATIGADWTKVVIPLNLNDTKVSVWINATVTSTTTAGETLAVRAVKLSAKYVATTSTRAIRANSYFNCTTPFTVSLTNAFLNSSTIDLLVRDRLVFSRTTYPASPVYAGNETVGAYAYRVYRITGATATGPFYALSVTPNVLADSKLKSRGLETAKALVGEPVTVVLPATANVTVVETKASYLNVNNATLAFLSPGTYTIVANATDLQNLIVGLQQFSLTVGYGAFSVSFVDVDGRPLDYETVALSVKNLNTGETKSLSAKASAALTQMKCGVHSLSLSFKGLALGSATLDLWIGTNGTTITVPCSTKRLPADYRGVARSLIFEADKRLVNVTTETKRPYGATKVLLDGKGAFKLLIDYYGYRPTRVDVRANVTVTSANWDGYYLAITGSLGSVGEVTVTDLYRLRVDAYDRLGNLLPLPSYALVNGSQYSLPSFELCVPPAYYNVTLPPSVGGFQLYSWADGLRNASRVVDVSTKDVALRCYYRVPTRAEVGAYQVTSLWEWLSRVVGRAFGLQADEAYSTVYLDGRLLDYYGNGAPSRPLLLRLYLTAGGNRSLLAELSLVTDASGYFRTPDLKLIRNATYEAEVSYYGDDVYVGTSKAYSFEVSALPVAPVPVVAIPATTLIAVLVGVAAAVAVALAVTKAVKHAVEEAFEERRRFVKHRHAVEGGPEPRTQTQMHFVKRRGFVRRREED